MPLLGEPFEIALLFLDILFGELGVIDGVVAELKNIKIVKYASVAIIFKS